MESRVVYSTDCKVKWLTSLCPVLFPSFLFVCNPDIQTHRVFHQKPLIRTRPQVWRGCLIGWKREGREGREGGLHTTCCELRSHRLRSRWISSPPFWCPFDRPGGTLHKVPSRVNSINQCKRHLWKGIRNVAPLPLMVGVTEYARRQRVESTPRVTVTQSCAQCSILAKLSICTIQPSCINVMDLQTSFCVFDSWLGLIAVWWSHLVTM